MSTLAENLRSAREAAELTREALADLAGVSVSTIARTELEGHLPNVKAVQAMADALHLSVADLFRPALEPKAAS